MSVTPTNLGDRFISKVFAQIGSFSFYLFRLDPSGKLGDQTYLRKMERKVFSLEESSGAFSGTAVDDMVRSGNLQKLTECTGKGG